MGGVSGRWGHAVGRGAWPPFGVQLYSLSCRVVAPDVAHAGHARVAPRVSQRVSPVAPWRSQASCTLYALSGAHTLGAPTCTSPPQGEPVRTKRTEVGPLPSRTLYTLTWHVASWCLPPGSWLQCPVHTTTKSASKFPMDSTGQRLPSAFGRSSLPQELVLLAGRVAARHLRVASRESCTTSVLNWTYFCSPLAQAYA